MGRVVRHGELVLDAGDARGTSYSAGFCLDWEDIPSLSFSSVLFSSSCSTRSLAMFPSPQMATV